MAEEPNGKWYSNGLNSEEAKKLEKRYAKIGKPTFGLTDRDDLALQFSLRYENDEVTDWYLSDQGDMKELFTRTNTYETSKLEGKVVEAFVDVNLLKGLSVNENLV